MKRVRKTVLVVIISFVIVAMQIMDTVNYNVIQKDSDNVYAATKTLTLGQAVSLAKCNNRKYRKTKSKISLQQAKYTQAVKSAQLKKKNMTTFRWSPLLSFHFPESPSLEDEYNWVYKPMQIQAQISKLKHELTDIMYEVEEKASNLYVQIYTYQERNEYYKEKLESLNQLLEKNKARLYAGIGKQSDVELISKQIESTSNMYNVNMQKFNSSKEKLSDMISLDVRVGYSFVMPYKEADIPRSCLDEIINYTLEQSQVYYETKIDAQLALTSMNTNYEYMERHYGSDMKIISSYVNSIRRGGKVDTDAFKDAYDRFLDKIDSYWRGKKKILFIRIPREWFKGEMDGVRYVEDDPYILYTDALEYIEAKEEMENTCKEITQNVKSGFENLKLTRNSYLSMKETVEKLEKELEKSKIKNKLGEISFQEYQEEEKLYQETQLDMTDALQLYTQTLNSYDRLTCGAVSEYLRQGTAALDASSGGVSNVDEMDGSKIKYEISSRIEDNIFEFRISIPKDYNMDITAYELYIDDMMVGERTEISSPLRHLMLAIKTAEKAYVRFYEGDKFLAQCEYDPYSFSGILEIKGGGVREENKNDEIKEPEKKILGTYSLKEKDGTNMVELSIKPNVKESISYYKIFWNDKTLGEDKFIPVDEGFKYLKILKSNMSYLKIGLYDSDKKEKYIAGFDELQYVIYYTEPESE